MALQVPSFPNPHDKANPLIDVYAWPSGFNLDIFGGDKGYVVFNVNPNEAAWQDRPIDQIKIEFGQVLAPGPPFSPPVAYPTKEEFMADPEFATAYATIGAKLEAAAAATHPLLIGAVPV
jgi:hypothetical protein